MTVEAQIYKKIGKLTPDLKKEALYFIETILKRQESIKKSEKAPVFGCAKGQFEMSSDFDDPLEDFKEYMES